MGVVAVQARIEVDLVAVQAAGLGANPVHEGGTVALATVVLTGDDVVDIEVVAPGQVVPLAEADDPSRVLVALLERGDQPVTLGPLLVDPVDELLAAADAAAEVEDRLVSEMCFRLP